MTEERNSPSTQGENRKSRHRGEYGKIIIFIVWLSKWSCQKEAGKESFGGLKLGAILI